MFPVSLCFINAGAATDSHLFKWRTNINLQRCGFNALDLSTKQIPRLGAAGFMTVHWEVQIFEIG